jgi:large conductance mechanosensitive channel
MKNMLKEFKDFIATGNMIDLAVGVILAGVVGAVIKAFTEGIMMQIVAAIFGQPDFSAVRLKLRTLDDGTEVNLEIGTLINTIITLLITGLVLFLIVKAYNKMKKPKEEAAGPTEIELLTEIRDSLRRN